MDPIVQTSPVASVVSPVNSYIAGYEYCNQDHSGGYYGEVYEGGMSFDTSDRQGGIDFEGATVASTSSYMSEVEVLRVDQWPPQGAGYVMETPTRELDDASDGVVDGLHRWATVRLSTDK